MKVKDLVVGNYYWLLVKVGHKKDVIDVRLVAVEGRHARVYQEFLYKDLTDNTMKTGRRYHLVGANTLLPPSA